MSEREAPAEQAGAPGPADPATPEADRFAEGVSGDTLRVWREDFAAYWRYYVETPNGVRNDADRKPANMHADEVTTRYAALLDEVRASREEVAALRAELDESRREAGEIADVLVRVQNGATMREVLLRQDASRLDWIQRTCHDPADESIGDVTLGGSWQSVGLCVGDPRFGGHFYGSHADVRAAIDAAMGAAPAKPGESR